ncbi:hypothetical protein ACLOJK_026900 [Asimina triloba]
MQKENSSQIPDFPPPSLPSERIKKKRKEKKKQDLPCACTRICFPPLQKGFFGLFAFSSLSPRQEIRPKRRSHAFQIQSFACFDPAFHPNFRVIVPPEEGMAFRLSQIFLALILLRSFAPASQSSDDDFRRAFPIVEPDSGHIKLRLSQEGLKAIERITTPIAAIAVIGPYRSGKSFLLNQLLSLSCYEVTLKIVKGIWVWGTPIELVINGVKTSVLYLDTEGFESVGKSNVYDDRIFALATVMSSVLIYNLPETGQDVAFEPAKLLWLIQRDFLQGKSVQEMVNGALQRVPNYDGDRNIDQINQIRESLAIMGDNSTAFSLPQKLMTMVLILVVLFLINAISGATDRSPQASLLRFFVGLRKVITRVASLICGHLKKVAERWRPVVLMDGHFNPKEKSLPCFGERRTKLCDLIDGDLDPMYIKKREQLKDLVASIVHPKIVQGKPLNGKEFVSFLEQILDALNKGEIPSTGSLVEVFNKAILERCLKLYNQRMEMMQLPLSEPMLQQGHDNAREEAMKVFDQEHFGRHHAKRSAETLDEAIQKAYKNIMMGNEYQSARLCEALYSKCEDIMDQLQVLRLPSMAKFNDGSRSLFIKEYNNRLFNWLVAFSLVMVVVGRFIVKFILLEIGAWAMFIFLETYTRMFWSAESLYYNPAWHFIVTTWETIVYSPILDLDR